MADGSLTAREFWKLSHKERMARCGELSEHESFVARLTDPSPPASPPCNICKHYFGYGKCEAFPNGVPADHIRAVMADQLMECRNEFRFTAKE